MLVCVDIGAGVTENCGCTDLGEGLQLIFIDVAFFIVAAEDPAELGVSSIRNTKFLIERFDKAAIDDEIVGKQRCAVCLKALIRCSPSAPLSQI